MRDIALQMAGALAIATAIAHGAIGELRVFARAQIELPRTRNLLRMVWQASTIDWIAIGVLLMAAPAFGSQSARHWIVAVAVFVYGYAAIGQRHCQSRTPYWLDADDSRGRASHPWPLSHQRVDFSTGKDDRSIMG